MIKVGNMKRKCALFFLILIAGFSFISCGNPYLDWMLKDKKNSGGTIDSTILEKITVLVGDPTNGNPSPHTINDTFIGFTTARARYAERFSFPLDTSTQTVKMIVETENPEADIEFSCNTANSVAAYTYQYYSGSQTMRERYAELELSGSASEVTITVRPANAYYTKNKSKRVYTVSLAHPAP